MTTAVRTAIGQRSTLFLLYTYQATTAGPDFDPEEFERMLCEDKSWQPKRLDDFALLPHLDTLSSGKLLRRYTVGSALGNVFGAREGAWTFASERDETLEVNVCDPPSVYVFDTGYVFIAIGVQPRAFDLATYQDTLNALVRRGVHRLRADSLPDKARTWTLQRGTIAGSDLRTWLAALVPGLASHVPIGGRQNPLSIGVLFSSDPIDSDDRHRLRLAHSSSQDVAPSERDRRVDAHPSIWSPSGLETCLMSTFGVQWLVDPRTAFLKDQLLPTIRSSYLYKWMLVAHQRMYLLQLTKAASEVSKSRYARGADALRIALLRYTAEYNFGHISDEERHDEFYRALRGALDVEGLFREAKEEITEVDDHAGARQATRLNLMLAFLTTVLTPVGLVIGTFEKDTLPKGFEIGWLVSASGLRRIFGHGNFQLTLLVAVLGTAVFLYFRSERSLRDYLRRRRVRR